MVAHERAAHDWAHIRAPTGFVHGWRSNPVEDQIVEALDEFELGRRTVRRDVSTVLT